MDEPIQDLQERLARLEAQVAYLLKRLDGPREPEAPVRPAAQAAEPVSYPPPRIPPPRIPPPARPAPTQTPKQPNRGNPILLVATAGAGLFLVGTFFFLRWSIQRGWIGPEFRFLMGLLVGLALATLAARMLLGKAPDLGALLLLAGLGTLMLTLRWGAFSYHFFPAALGLAGCALAVLAAGALAARARSQGALAAALVAGLVAPLAFSEGGHHEIALALYLAAQLAAALLVPYLTGSGARWHGARWLATVGTWVLLVPACAVARTVDAGLLLGLLALHLLLAGLWAWLPRQAEPRPGTPGLLWSLPALFSLALSWILWHDLNLPVEWFAGPILALAALHLLLVKPLRQRLGSRQADPGLLALAVGHLALAVPVAMDLRWIGPAWGLLALGAAWALERGEERELWDAGSRRWFRLLTLALAVLTALAWWFACHLWLGLFNLETPFLNPPFITALLSIGAWALLARRDGRTALAAFAGLQLVANLALATELGRLAWSLGGSERMAGIVSTLVLALSGAAQWLGSRRLPEPRPRRAFALAGYAWLAVAAGKLLLADLAHVDTPLRALAFLGVGGIFLAAALAANRTAAPKENPR